MAPTNDTGWYDQQTGAAVADPFDDQPPASLAGPTIASVNLLAHLHATPYGQALVESVEQWKNALTEAVEREAVNARYWLNPLTREVAYPSGDAACLAEARASLTRIETLQARIAHADHLLAGADEQHYR